MTTTRFAPSPTGWIHIGNLRAALFNYAIARQNGGTFILRIDDTDPERSKEEYVVGLKEDLTWLGLNWDREERQSLRLDRYMAAKERLLPWGGSTSASRRRGTGSQAQETTEHGQAAGL